jgi:hypothetical protein
MSSTPDKLLSKIKKKVNKYKPSIVHAYACTGEKFLRNLNISIHELTQKNSIRIKSYCKKFYKVKRKSKKYKPRY